MVKRSLQASTSGIQRARRAFALKGWTQENLAGEVNLKTRQPIWRFFTAKPVDRQIFMEICSILDLEWREIADNPPAEFPEYREVGDSSPLSIDNLVQHVRSQHHDKIQSQCGFLQLLEINHPVSIEDIYVDVNILEETASQQWLDIAELQSIEHEEFDRVGFGDIKQKQISGIRAVETYSKLRMLGKPGVGKTTFLKYLAMQCDRSGFAAHQVPIFITLKDFAEESRDDDKFNLLNYILQGFTDSDVANPSVIEVLLKAGRVLLLLDGMDEVMNDDMPFVLKEIRKFSEKYHKNQFVVTCRTAAQQLMIQGFTDVEIAPFTQLQITTFAQKWFAAFSKLQPKAGQSMSTQFIENLDLPENWQFRQMVVTPLFLHLACWVFHSQSKFPTKRTEFYKQGLDLLLGKWDEVRGIERDNVYRDFELPQKVKLLSHLAAVTFESGEYFFDQQTIQQYIGDYLQDLPDATSDPEELQYESESVLKAIESHHGLLVERARGIFSFSYLAFQEYFTARNIVACQNPQALDQALGGLVSHLTDPHWHEIFLLTSTMLRSADSLMQLMKQQIDGLVSKDPYLQEFLAWSSSKNQTVPVESKEATVRAFYSALVRTPQKVANYALACTLDQGLMLDFALDSSTIGGCAIDHSANFAHSHMRGQAISNIVGMDLDGRFHKSVQYQDELPNPKQNRQKLDEWWDARHHVWVEQLRSTTGQYRNINQTWDFSPEQQRLLQSYYDANQLLADCLNSNCEVTAAIREEIEATLVFSQQELENREWQGK